MQKGKIGVTTENIFPVIKKFLYSDHEIFLREIVSNAVDATQKLKTCASKGDFKGEMGDLTVRVTLGNGTITISDRGIGMTAEEIDKYINQIAFSGVNDFLEKYKDDANAIIGHFGLGFYSAFMVSKKVTIDTLSWKDGASHIRKVHRPSSGAVTDHQNLNCLIRTRLTAVLTLFSIFQTTARSICRNHQSRACWTSTASSCLFR